MIGQPLTLIHRSASGRDEFGNDVLVTSGTEPLRGGFAPEGSVELVAGRETVSTQPAVFARQMPVSPVGPLDQVLVPAVSSTPFDVDGEPAVWTSAYTNRFVGLVIKLQSVTG